MTCACCGEPFSESASSEELTRQKEREALVNAYERTLASLRDESRNGKPSALLEALAKLFQLKD